MSDYDDVTDCPICPQLATDRDDALREAEATNSTLATARFVADYWRGHILEQSRRLHADGSHAAGNGVGLGAHALCMVIAALDGETDPVLLGVGDDGRDGLRDALAGAT